MTRITQSAMQCIVRVPIKALASSRTPRAGAVAGLRADDHGAIDEGHAPQLGGPVRNRRRRPVEVRTGGNY